MFHRGLNLALGTLAAGWLCGCGTEQQDQLAVNYGIEVHADSEFATPQVPQEQAGTFGPDVGYPEPLKLAVWNAGVLDRGSFVVFESLEGDLTEAGVEILDSSRTMAVAPRIEPDSGASQVGVAVPYTLEEGPYTLELSVPGGVLIATVTFSVEGLPPTILGVTFEPSEPAAGEPYRIVFAFAPPGATISYVLSGDDGFSIFQILPCFPEGELCTELRSDILPGGEAGVIDIIIPSIEIDNQVVHVGDPILVTFK